MKKVLAMHAEPSTSDLVSVIIPVYNNAQELRCCLESVLRSDYDNLEVLVVDDGSTDASASVATLFAGVRVLRQKKPGQRSRTKLRRCKSQRKMAAVSG